MGVVAGPKSADQACIVGAEYSPLHEGRERTGVCRGSEPRWRHETPHGARPTGAKPSPFNPAVRCRAARQGRSRAPITWDLTATCQGLTIKATRDQGNAK